MSHPFRVLFSVVSVLNQATRPIAFSTRHVTDRDRFERLIAFLLIASATEVYLDTCSHKKVKNSIRLHILKKYILSLISIIKYIREPKPILKQFNLR